MIDEVEFIEFLLLMSYAEATSVRTVDERFTASNVEKWKQKQKRIQLKNNRRLVKIEIFFPIVVTFIILTQ